MKRGAVAKALRLRSQDAAGRGVDEVGLFLVP